MNDIEVQEWDPDWRRGWYLVVPLGTNFGLTDEDRPIAQFMYEHHARKFATPWMDQVQIIQNGEIT